MVGKGKQTFSAVETVFCEHGIVNQWCDSGMQALSILEDMPVDIVVVNETLPDMSGRGFVEAVVTRHPRVHCAVSSPLASHVFHETYEGLGVMMQLPAVPGRHEAGQLMASMNRIIQLQEKTVP